MLKWSIQPNTLDLKFTWKISRGSSNQKTNYYVSVTDGTYTGTGEAAGVTKGPGLDPIQEQFAALDLSRVSEESDLTELSKVSLGLRFAIESALVHYRATARSQSVPEYLGLDSVGPIPTSFSLPILEAQDIEPFFVEYGLRRFSVLKVKVDKAHPAESCLALGKLYKGPIRIDANEAFDTAAAVMKFADEISGHVDIEFLEQPIPSHLTDEYLQLRKLSSIPIVADESLQNQPLNQELIDQFDGINVKLMKAGGYLRAIEQLTEARRNGMKTMLGCMVETSLGISSALHIGANVDWYDLDGFLFFKDDPLNLVNESGGILRHS